MIIDCISDLHGFQPKLDGGDLLIIAGDLTARDKASQMMIFCAWASRQRYRKIIVVAGNHDGCLKLNQECGIIDDGGHFQYLQDSGCEFEGLKIWGSPWTPTFGDWHFMKDRGAQIKEKWDLIPIDTDILVTHGPPHGILDTIGPGSEHLGCEELEKVIAAIQPKLHVFGHIHGGYGVKPASYHPARRCRTAFVNASQVNEKYQHVNRPIRVELKD